MPSRIVLTAVELGVFGSLSEGAGASVDVAAEIGADPRATDRLMNALVALGLLTKDGDLFSNTAEAGRYLVPSSPEYAGGALMHAANLWESWSTLTDAVRRGRAVFEREERPDRDWTTSFISAMDWNARAHAPELIGLIDLDGVGRVLDVGGGSGAYAIEMCRAKPDLEAVVFDLPQVVPITQGYIERAGMASRVTTAAGDYTADELGRDFDLVLLSQILHSNSPSENLELLARCRRALRRAGRIVIQEFVVDESRTSPANAVIFALNMLVGTRAGDTYTQSEITAWLDAAGFADVRRIDPPSGATALLVAAAA